MTRIQAMGASSGGDSLRIKNLRPPTPLLPANVVTALAAYDDLLARQVDARNRAAELNTDKALADAEAKDDAATAAAIAAKQPVPAPENKQALVAAIETSTRELRGFEAAITKAENDLRNLSSAAAKASGYDAAKAHADMITAVRGHLTAAADAFQSFADKEILQAWLAGGVGFVPRTAVELTDVVPLERPRTMDNRSHVPVRELLDGILNSLQKGK